VAKCKEGNTLEVVPTPKTVAVVKKRAARFKKNSTLVFAMMDRRHMNAPGLFRNLKNIQNPGILDITYQYSKTESIRFVAAYALGVTEMRVVQALVAMCSQAGLEISDKKGSEVGSFLREAMRVPGVPLDGNGVGVRSSYKQLQREMGVSTTAGTKLLRDALEKLFNVSVYVTVEGKRRAFHLLTYFDDKDGNNADSGELNVGMNPLIAEAMARGGQFAALDMDEVRSIKGETTRFLHQHLCGYIDPGKARSVGMDKLCEYVWPESSDNDKTMKTRRASVRKGLAELGKMGWKIGEMKKDVFRVTRPNMENVSDTSFSEQKKQPKKTPKK
jgi:hypothetical protein